MDLKGLARVGAVTRLTALNAERLEIVKMFPDLASLAGHGIAKGGRKKAAAVETPGEPVPSARKREVSAEARALVSKRMKAYWANRRAKESTDTAPVEVAATGKGKKKTAKK